MKVTKGIVHKLLSLNAPDLFKIKKIVQLKIIRTNI